MGIDTVNREEIEEQFESLLGSIMAMSDVPFEKREDWKFRIEDIQDEIDNELNENVPNEYDDDEDYDA